MILRAYNCEYAEIDLLENVAVLELMRPGDLQQRSARLDRSDIPRKRSGD